MDSELSKILKNRRSVIDDEVSPEKPREAKVADHDTLSKTSRSSQRPGSFSDAGICDRQSFFSSSAPKAVVGSGAGSELLTRLQHRRSLVDGESDTPIGVASGKPLDSDNLIGEPDSLAMGKSGSHSQLQKSSSSGRLPGERPERSSSSSRLGTKKELRGATGGTMDSELLRRLTSRLHTVENEGNSWQSLPTASSADAQLARRAPRPSARSIVAVSARQAAAMADGLAIPEYGPWDSLWRGARTWVVEARIDRRILTARTTAPCATAGGIEPYVFATHVGVLCLGDGALFVCEAVAPPPGVEEDADYAQLLCSVRLGSLQRIAASPATPCALSFCIALGQAEVCDTTASKVEDVNCTPVVVVLFESPEEGAACKAAVTRKAAADGIRVDHVECPPPDLEGFSAALTSTIVAPEFTTGIENPSEI